MKKISSILFFLGIALTLSLGFISGGGGGGNAINSYHADNVDNAGGNNVVLRGIFNGDLAGSFTGKEIFLASDCFGIISNTYPPRINFDYTFWFQVGQHTASSRITDSLIFSEVGYNFGRDVLAPNFRGSFIGDGSGLTGLPAPALVGDGSGLTNLTITLPDGTLTNGAPEIRIGDDGSFTSGSYSIHAWLPSGDSPEIDFVDASGARKMLFGYQNRGIFYSDDIAGGFYFYAGGIAAGGFGSDSFADKTFRLPVNSGNYGEVQIKSVLTMQPAAAPATPAEGMIYYNATTHHFMGYNGTAWKQLDNTL